MSSDADWEFWLTGNSFDLRGMSESVGTRYFNVYGGVDHWNDCKNDDFRMNTIYTKGEEDPILVWQIGYELVSLFNGAAFLFDQHHRKVGIEALVKGESKVDYCPHYQKLALLGKPDLNQHQINQEILNVKDNARLLLLHQGTENKNFYMLLKYLDMPATWSNYYKILETVETFAKQDSVDLQTNKTQREKFASTANNYDLAGFDARHGFKAIAGVNKEKSMTLDQAYIFISSVVKKYLFRPVTA
ncbi:hypothetical protein FE275_19360 [Pseudomonas koreensis]|uniref:hypothetical protein n=1 Tax=Pseudomonas koreensis TaxID=198620 RepID=UPI001239B844|nr:hypothetical protein [Pseudomonas koreensis]KAA8739125.1 hypothetical protein FE275_19360 [Pseudomonas koreensis]